MRLRLRPAYTSAELAEIYPRPHQHARWSDHRLRVDVLTSLVRWFEPTSIADLSCGDATIANAIPSIPRYLGDLASGYKFQGPIEETLQQIPDVDLFICCETLEHLDDPDSVLAAIRKKARCLVLSTPDGEITDENPEHYWGWDTEGVRAMLNAAGWTPRVMLMLDFPHLSVAYQAWGCE